MRLRRPTVSEAERRLAFERFTQSRLDRAYRWAGLLLRDHAAAEDAVHDAAIQAWTHWDELREPTRIDAWFDRILLNVCRARMRRRSVPLIALDERSEVPAADPFANLGERDLVRRALGSLDADHRMAVVLRYGASLTPAEIAARTGVREGTVKSRIHYALRRLRAEIDASERTAGGPR